MPFVPSFRTTNTSSSLLSLFLCSSSPIEDDDTFTAYVPYSMRMQPQTFIRSGLPKKPRIRRKRRSKMIIGAPTNFRHDVHLGNDYKADVSYAFWDSERWRQELMKKNLVIPPLDTGSVIEESPPTPLKPNATKRNSITPQKRKPVPSLFPLSSAVPPHEVPLPPSPTRSLRTCEDTHDLQSDPAALSESSLPTLESPSRGPSIDDDPASLSERVSIEQIWEKVNYSPGGHGQQDFKTRPLPSLPQVDQPVIQV